MGLQNDSLSAFSDSACVYNMPTVFCQSMATDRSNFTKEGMKTTILSEVKRNERIPKYTTLFILKVLGVAGIWATLPCC